MCRKLLSNPYFVKTQSVSLDFVATPTRDRREVVSGETWSSSPGWPTADSHPIYGNSHLRLMLVELTGIGVEIELHIVLLWKP